MCNCILASSIIKSLLNKPAHWQSAYVERWQATKKLTESPTEHMSSMWFAVFNFEKRVKLSSKVDIMGTKALWVDVDSCNETLFDMRNLKSLSFATAQHNSTQNIFCIYVCFALRDIYCKCKEDWLLKPERYTCLALYSLPALWISLSMLLEWWSYLTIYLQITNCC